MSEQLDIREKFEKDRAVFKVSGEIDIYTVRAFKEKLYALISRMSSGTVREVAVDCGDLKYIDSTGLGVLVGALKLARQEGVSLLIRNLKDNIRKLFDITSLDKVFTIEKD